MEILRTFSKDSKVTYPLLSDPESKMITAFGLFNKESNKEHKWHGVPYPCIFFVNPEGRVDGRFAEKMYQHRPGIDTILAFIQERGGRQVKETE